MSSETKTCQSCKSQFIIEDEDFQFYRKIDVPAPTWCPECRFQRRLIIRNERNFYKHNCELCKKNIISVYDKNQPFPIYCQDCWWGESWDGIEFGKEYDFSKPLLEQYKSLFLLVPEINLNGHQSNIGCDYVNYVVQSKNCYLCFGGGYIENVMFSTYGVRTRDSAEIYFSFDCELCYEILYCDNCFKVFYGKNCKDCRDCYFIDDCINCDNCILCSGLRNKSYFYKNKQYTREEYNEIKNKFEDEFQKGQNKFFDDFRKICLGFPKKFLDIKKSNNCLGDHINESKSCFNSFNIIDSENCRYSQDVMIKGREVYDTTGMGVNGEFIYESSVVSMGISHILFSLVIRSNCLDLNYCSNMHSCSHCFACIGLRNKQYCILNKQYSKEEYKELVQKIIKHMSDMPYIDKMGRVYKYGEFFPLEFSPFAYNETIVQEYFPLTKEQAISQGYRWKDPDTKEYKITKKTNDLPDHIKDVPDSITNEIIECSHKGTCTHQCTTAFKIIPEELEFYRRMNLPLPRLCPNCRHYERLSQRNPLKLWHRKCMCGGTKSENQIYQNISKHEHGEGRCPNEFETSYAPERSEIVYCESCYQNEVI